MTEIDLSQYFESEVVPIVEGLLLQGHYSSERIEAILEEVRSPNEYVVAIAYDALPPSAKRAVCILCRLSEVDLSAISSQDAHALKRAGFLVEEPSKLRNTSTSVKGVLGVVYLSPLEFRDLEAYSGGIQPVHTIPQRVRDHVSVWASL
jgi:hypothetical protein